LTCDYFLEGMHFLTDKHPPDAIGWKCLARALSDIAAMGGRPCCFLLSLALPRSHTGHWLTEFLSGLRRAAKRFACVLAGGDTTVDRKVLISVTAIGELPAGCGLLRSAARPGDLIYVSGRLGEAELGLQILRDRKERPARNDPRLRKHLYPEPRLELGQWLAEKRIATAMMDISDGLSSDLRRLCAASGVGARIEADSLPVVRLDKRRHAQGAGLDVLKLALNGGDDYELLFTVSRNRAKLLPHSFHGLALTPIGDVTMERKLLLRDAYGYERAFIAAGWDPFRHSK
jgi:thiamine-monophosphate kinase